MPNESIFAATDDDWRTVACVNFGVDPWHGYAEGYRRAGQCLLEHVAKTGSDQDYLVYPIIFCYRHAVEAYLKQIVLLGGACLERRLDFPDTHDLAALWAAVKPLIEEIWPDAADEPSLEVVDLHIDELAGADPTSFAFRYPVTKRDRSTQQREPSFDPELRNVGLRSFAGKMEELLETLSAVATGFSAQADLIAEFRAEQAYESGC